MTATRQNVDMTAGPLLRKFIRFVLPLFFTNLLQCFYNAADMMIVSFSPVADAVGAIGITASFVYLVLNIFIGSALGANVAVARCLGAKDGEGAESATHTSVLLSFLLGILGGAAGIVFARPVLVLMGAEGELLDLAVTYAAIYFSGTPFLAVTNYTAGVFRAKGDAKTPLLALSFSGVLNVALNALFVMAFHLSVEGVAIATVIANAVSALLLLWVLARDGGPCRFSLRRLRLDRRATAVILKVGIPLGIQGALFSISNMAIQSSVLVVNNVITPPGSAFQPVVKGNAATSNLEAFCYAIADSVNQATTSFVGQNHGARNPERIGRVMAYAYLTAVICSAAVSIGIFLFNKPLLALYNVVPGTPGDLDSIAYATAVLRMKYLFLPYFFLSCTTTGTAFLTGQGKSMTAAVITLIGTCAFRIVWILTVFPAFPTLEAIYVSYPISWILTALALFIAGESYRRKMKKEIEKSTDA